VNLASLRQHLDKAWDNPSTEHDARSILSPFKVAVWLTLLNLLIAGGACLAIFVFPEVDRDMRAMVAGRGLGPYLISGAQLVLCWFLTLVLPLRVAGLLDGPRWSGYFQQVVATGISPARFFFGKWLSSQVFVLTLMFTTLPYMVLFGSFGLDSIFEPILNYLLIYLYANALMLLTFALGLFIYEWTAVGLVTLGSSVMCFIEFFPFPGGLVPWTPTRSIIRPFVGYVFNSPWNQKILPFYEHAALFGLAVPNSLLCIAVWTVVSAASLVYLLLGPRHFFSIGLNNYESVTLGGDSRRAMMFRMRPLLTRQVQLAFFYENRSAWLARHDLGLRALARFLVFGMITLLWLGTFLDPGMIVRIRGADEYLIFMSVGWQVPLVLWTLTTIRVQSDYRQSWRSPLGPRLGVASLDFILFGALVLLIGAVLTAFFTLAQPSLSALRFTSYSAPVDYGHLVLLGTEWFCIGVIYLLSVQVVSKLMGLVNLSRPLLFVFTLMFMLASLFGPLLLGALLGALARSLDSSSAREFLKMLATVAHCSPLTRYIVSVDPSSQTWMDSGFLGSFGFWLYFPPWLALLLVVFFLRLKRRRLDPAERYTADAPLPELLVPLLAEERPSQRKRSALVVVTQDSQSPKRKAPQKAKLVSSTADTEELSVDQARLLDPPPSADLAAAVGSSSIAAVDPSGATVAVDTKAVTLAGSEAEAQKLSQGSAEAEVNRPEPESAGLKDSTSSAISEQPDPAAAEHTGTNDE